MKVIELPIVGRTVEAVHPSGDSVIIEFERNPFESPRQPPTRLVSGGVMNGEPLRAFDDVSIIGSKVTSAISEDGYLTVTFSTGHVLNAEPHPRFESWEVDIKSSRTLYVCLGGGEIAIFLPD